MKRSTTELQINFPELLRNQDIDTAFMQEMRGVGVDLAKAKHGRDKPSITTMLIARFNFARSAPLSD